MQPQFLYIEDDPLSREIMAMILEGLGYTNVVIFSDSRNFMEKLSASSYMPDIVFLDIHVEPYDGFEMLRMLREQPDFATSKVIALTASVMNEEIARLRHAGFDGAVSKPLDFDEFPALLERILRGELVWYVS